METRVHRSAARRKVFGVNGAAPRALLTPALRTRRPAQGTDKNNTSVSWHRLAKAGGAWIEELERIPRFARSLLRRAAI
jgi:hypothetical protein